MANEVGMPAPRADDIPSLAQAMYPGLKSEAVPTPEGTPPADERSPGEKIYGSEPVDGLAQAKAGIEAGKAKPASEVAAAESEAAAAAEPGPYGLAAGPLADQFGALVKEAGLDQAGAGKLVALHKEALTEVSTKYWADQGTTWQKQAQAQFGSRLNSMVDTVRGPLNDPRLTPPAFRQLLEQYRIGNHPIVIDTLSRWAAEMNRRGRR